MKTEDNIVSTTLLGASVTFLLHGGGRDEGEVVAVYLSRNGWPMLLVRDAAGKLAVCSHDSVTVRRNS